MALCPECRSTDVMVSGMVNDLVYLCPNCGFDSLDTTKTRRVRTPTRTVSKGMTSRYVQLREKADREYDEAVRKAGEAYISAIDQARKKHLAERVEADKLLETSQIEKEPSANKDGE